MGAARSTEARSRYAALPRVELCRRVLVLKAAHKAVVVDLEALAQRSDELWEESILPRLSGFIEIHALSPLFEPNWAELGELDATIDLFCAWLDEQEIAGLSHEVHRIEDKSPVLLVTIEGTGPGEVIFYSHLDKQPSKPELWSEGLHPLTVSYTHLTLPPIYSV